MQTQSELAGGASINTGVPPSQAALLDELIQAKKTPSTAAAAVRLREPNRLQAELKVRDLESLIPQGHRAHRVWGYVVRQDLSCLNAKIKAREDTVGRHAIDPRVMFAP